MKPAHSGFIQWPLQRDCNAFYGNPDPGGDGEADESWKAANLIRIPTPWPMVWSWPPFQAVKSIQFHRGAAPALSRVLTVLAARYPTEAKRRAAGLHLLGGTFSFRRISGSHSLSMHSWGIAIDLDPEGNPFGRRPGKCRMPEDVVAAFEAEGFVWGGRWRRPDAMHFQAARVR